MWEFECPSAWKTHQNRQEKAPRRANPISRNIQCIPFRKIISIFTTTLYSLSGQSYFVLRTTMSEQSIRRRLPTEKKPSHYAFRRHRQAFLDFAIQVGARGFEDRRNGAHRERWFRNREPRSSRIKERSKR